MPRKPTIERKCSSGRCRRPADEGFGTCSTCRASGARSKAKRRAQGKCHECSEPSEAGKRLCRKCSDKHLTYKRERRLEQKKLVYDHYGRACACCGETEPAFLTIDHVDGGGGEHRKKIGARIYDWLIKNGFPAGFRVLCYNCNCARGHYGSCPHEARGSCLERSSKVSRPRGSSPTATAFTGSSTRARPMRFSSTAGPMWERTTKSPSSLPSGGRR